MPVLARLFESAGMATVVVTNMPYWAERVGAPRALGVEFPFGHILGMPGDTAMQKRVIEQALRLLETAATPGTIEHSAEPWPTSLKEAIHLSHAPEPPPITAQMGKHIGHLLRGLRRR